MANNKEKGNLGESIACKYLTRRGFEIIERNYWQKCGEIDIIAKNKSLTHFIEVKSVSCEIKLDSVTHKTVDFYRPEDNLHTWKLERLAKTIQVYLAEKGVSDETDFYIRKCYFIMTLDSVSYETTYLFTPISS